MSFVRHMKRNHPLIMRYCRHRGYATSGKKTERNPCDLKQQAKIQKSMWFNPVCCNIPCEGLAPRCDQLYYKPSDKYRKFQQTWSDCPELRLVKKKLCCTEKVAIDPMERRKRRETCLQRPKVTCGDLLEKMCEMKATGQCPKIKLPGCREVRDPPRCFKIRQPSDCQKVRAPFPSYSECDHPKPKALMPTECLCWHFRPFCPYGNEKKDKNDKNGKKE